MPLSKDFFPPSLLFRALIRKGSLTVISAEGRTYTYAGGPGPQVTIKLHDPALYWKLLYNPHLYLGEAYMYGRLTVENGNLDDFLGLLALNHDSVKHFWATQLRARLRYALKSLWQDNSLIKARQHITHHYDISNDLYKLFLDKDMQYSCAYFKNPHDTLEQAQQNKKSHIISKLRLEPGMRVLDIGCGWGGLAIEMARQKGVSVVGVTLSDEQHALGMQRVRDAGLSDRIDLKLLDYRKLEGQFDRIVSIGMFEHVGMPHYGEYFGKIHHLLANDGLALLHSIGYREPSLATQPWLEKYIFRKGYLPALSECIPSIEKAGFWIADVETLRLHYSWTLREWKNRFRAHREQIIGMYDDTFYRMFDLYLTGCELAMIHCGTMAFQIQFSKKIDAIPVTRHYMYEGGELEQRKYGS